MAFSASMFGWEGFRAHDKGRARFTRRGTFDSHSMVDTDEGC